MDTFDLKKMQDTQYQMLKTFAQICDENNIRYYLAYGTLLGAVRHQGTIPWDYDIDLCMTREEFRRFKAVAANQLPAPYFIKRVGASAYNGLYRICKKGSAVYTETHGQDEAWPIHVDIFILDVARSYHYFAKLLVTSISRYLLVAKLSDYEKAWLYERFRNKALKRFIVRSGNFFRYIFGEQGLERIVFCLMASPRKTDKYIIITDIGKVYPVAWFGESVNVRYEESVVKAPSHTDDLLKMWYGDYMSLPPESERYTAGMEKWLVNWGEE